MNNMPKLQWKDRVAEARCGVYMLMLAGQVQYIGKSTDVDARVATHRNEARIHFDFVSVAEVHQDALAETERTLIKQHRPPKNIAHNDIPNSRRRKAQVPYKKMELLIPLDTLRMLEYICDHENRTARNVVWMLIEEAYVTMREKDYKRGFAALLHEAPKDTPP